MRYSIFFIPFFSVFFCFGQESSSNSTLDSILIFRNNSKNIDFTFEERIVYAKKAIDFSSFYAQDSTEIKSYKALSSVYLNQWDIEALKSVNFKILKLADKSRDTIASANANYILGFAYHDELRLDSAYFYYSKAVKQFKTLENTKSYLDVLINMSDIQHSERDYIGAEINAVSALKTLKNLPKTDENIELQWSRYNLIGIISGELKNFEKALEYHELAFIAIKGHPNEYFYRVYSKNNIASIYRRSGDYKQAVKLFNEILEDKSLKTRDSSSYANITANLGYSLFLSGNYNKETISALFKESFELTNVLNDKIAIMATSAYYSEFLQKENQKDSAKKYANLAYKIAKNTNTNDFIFQTLKIKSELEKDSSSIFLNEYIKFNDSLITAERSIRNKFARIDYETDVIIQEKEAISKQNLWLLIISIGLLLSIVFLYVIKTQREKNKELQLAQQQQEANEEIYNLMLSQQDKMDEARALEKKRISQEIHDGILGRLFGTRLSLDSLNMLNTEEAIVSRENYIKDLMEIEKDIRKVSHDLNTDFISHASFSDMISTLVETQCTAYNLNYKTKIAPEIKWDNLTNKTKIHIYRIVQESLQNIYKHAKAKLVNLTLQQEDNLISLCIIDDGVGYDKSKQKEGIGLKNIKSRVEAISGILEIASQINEGTTIKIKIPI
ncbi:tetratricopeptide repeat-containing sensor histidine kinase [Lacinutrix sp. Bg11-31]|uniref:ATP-binding protein n=1 Tax=Lacinutrix sp. Bg11-31 TaxID=2057808 RepID=UPI000C30F2D5|nr:tetratricopeptide repeat-containing sensor histidine kinase [Lacinutrix sp. Bg11-31]AUC82584.1 two-component sensor histidine kinase [Lacinutrix sp. Bg11-31]